MVEDLSKSDKEILRRIAVSLEDASVDVKACNLKGAVPEVSNANDMARILVERSPTSEYFRQIRRCTSYINSVLLTISSSQNAADQASRIVGMLEILAMVLR